MSLSLVLSERQGGAVRSGLAWTDCVVAIVFIVIYAIGIHAFQYKDGLAESDLYRVLVGLMDGANSGQGIASPLHYDRNFGFGYLEAFYSLADPATLHDPDRLMALMNEIGFWSMIPTLVFFWWAVQLGHGSFAATIALFIFALGPMNPELFTSGHQTIPMFALLCAGATLMFLPLSGWRAVLATAGAASLLLAGLTTRGEIFLAFPWLVLTRIDRRSIGSFLLSGILRSIAPAAALIAFIVLKSELASDVHTELGSTVGGYFREYYTTLTTIVPGLVYMALGCGIVTVVAATLAGLYVFGSRLFRRQPDPGRLVADLWGPLALVLLPALFFLPNPVPTRHFEMTLAGMAILIGVTLARHPALGRGAAFGLALAIGGGNQAMSAAVRPALLRINQAHSPYLPRHEDYPTATHADLGWEWRRHTTLVEERAAWRAFGNMVSTSCDTHLVVLSDEVAQIFSRLYAGGVAVAASQVTIPVPPGATASPIQADAAIHLALVGTGTPRLPGTMGVRNGKTFVMVEEAHAWPYDPVAAVLADRAYDHYTIVSDPYTKSLFDKTPIPPDRVAHFGCSGGGPVP